MSPPSAFRHQILLALKTSLCQPVNGGFDNGESIERCEGNFPSHVDSCWSDNWIKAKVLPFSPLLERSIFIPLTSQNICSSGGGDICWGEFIWSGSSSTAGFTNGYNKDTEEKGRQHWTCWPQIVKQPLKFKGLEIVSPTALRPSHLEGFNRRAERQKQFIHALNRYVLSSGSPFLTS